MKTKKKTKGTPWRFLNKETLVQAMRRAGVPNAHQLSIIAGCSPQTACNWLAGRKPLSVYVAVLEKALAVTVAK